ncbi:MAG: 4Fe-4S ferredoxin, partial [Deltaproteobacteria bacterium]|nr:4Fe-4S ferredoxin [Deltaproteobacteria bacterium]
MSPARVYFTDMRTRQGSNLLQKTQRLFQAAGFADCIRPNDLVAVKLHWGEV